MRRTVVILAIAVAAGTAHAQLTLYEGPNFQGRAIRVDQSTPNLDDAGFNDRAASAVVQRGQWQVCADAFFRGTCVTLGPGEYRSLDAMRMRNAISSIRELGWTPDGRGGWDGRPDAPPPSYARPSPRDDEHWGRERWGSGARAVLFDRPGLAGRAIAVDPRGIPNLEFAGFNDRAASLRVEAGYWLFCSDANFQGECRTFAPGDYAQLPRGLDGRISSGRRISNDYPYRQPPRWER